jgi:hypothetical protein
VRVVLVHDRVRKPHDVQDSLDIGDVFDFHRYRQFLRSLNAKIALIHKDLA